ncbi:MAG TPA: hypothetical protein VIR33_18785 [Thermopolyspora sp.]
MRTTLCVATATAVEAREGNDTFVLALSPFAALPRPPVKIFES